MFRRKTACKLTALHGVGSDGEGGNRVGTCTFIELGKFIVEKRISDLILRSTAKLPRNHHVKQTGTIPFLFHCFGGGRRCGDNDFMNVFDVDRFAGHLQNRDGIAQQLLDGIVPVFLIAAAGTAFILSHIDDFQI